MAKIVIHRFHTLRAHSHDLFWRQIMVEPWQLLKMRISYIVSQTHFYFHDIQTEMHCSSSLAN